MKLQRRDSRRVEQPLYDGAGVLGLEEYFADSTRLTSSVLRYHFEPGASEGMHRHDATAADSCTPDDSDELYLVISGELVMTLEGERTTLAAGDAAYAPSRTWHGIANESETPAEMVLIFGAPRSSRASLRELRL
jgi:oxalate decarboxylase/phosphoglucose isomerase-like protein (cupin superfamily)